MKYRIFQKSTKKYVEDTREYALMPDGTLIYNYSGWEWSILDYPDDFVIERFTGLMDSNGKDIYEGDIVFGDDKSTDSVCFKDGCYWIDDQWLYDHNNDINIVGNIQENPELIEK